jgi:hypothetical protein
MVSTPGAVSSITSTVTVSTVEALGGFTGLALFRATFFAMGRFGPALAKRFFGFDLLPPWLRAVDLLFRRVTRFFR